MTLSPRQWAENAAQRLVGF